MTACVVSYAAVLSVVMQRQRRLLHAWLRKCLNFLVSSKPSLDTQNKASMLSEIFLNSRNETHLARVSIFVYLVTDAYIYLSIYSISFILFYFILFIIFYRRSEFFVTFFLIYFVIICPVPECSGMFRDAPECSMFRVLLTPYYTSGPSCSKVG